MKRIRSILLGVIAATAVCGMASAQGNYPNQMVRIVVPFSAGSITDNLARILADKLSETWKQQVIVENRAGLPGTTAVAKSPPDGYTLMLTSNGHTIAAVINKSLQFDPVKDFAGVSQVAAVPMVMIVPPDFPARTLQEFVAMARQQPGKLNFSSAGVASTSFLSGEILRQNADIQMVHVPYKGAPEAITAVMRGDAQFYFAPIPSAEELPNMPTPPRRSCGMSSMSSAGEGTSQRSRRTRALRRSRQPLMRIRVNHTSKGHASR